MQAVWRLCVVSCGVCLWCVTLLVSRRCAAAPGCSCCCVLLPVLRAAVCQPAGVLALAAALKEQAAGSVSAPLLPGGVCPLSAAA